MNLEEVVSLYTCSLVIASLFLKEADTQISHSSEPMTNFFVSLPGQYILTISKPRCQNQKLR